MNGFSSQKEDLTINLFQVPLASAFPRFYTPIARLLSSCQHMLSLSSQADVFPSTRHPFYLYRAVHPLSSLVEDHYLGPPL